MHAVASVSPATAAVVYVACRKISVCIAAHAFIGGRAFSFVYKPSPACMNLKAACFLVCLVRLPGVGSRNLNSVKMMQLIGQLETLTLMVIVGDGGLIVSTTEMGSPWIAHTSCSSRDLHDIYIEYFIQTFFYGAVKSLTSAFSYPRALSWSAALFPDAFTPANGYAETSHKLSKVAVIYA